MAKEKFEKALADWPLTKMLKDGGIHVYGKYEQPGLSQRMLMFWSFFCLIVVGFVMFASFNVIAAAVVGIILILAYGMVVRSFLVSAWGKNVDVKIYPDKIQVRDGRYKSYDRSMPIEFRVEEHQKGLQERAKEIKHNRNFPRVYREAIEVVMQYGEKRVPIAELPLKEIEKGKALVIRLQNICEQWDEAARRLAEGQMRAASPAPVSDFGTAPPIR